MQKAGVESFNTDNIEMLLSDIFSGGIETTATTLKWALLYFIHTPNVQDKCYEEIIKVCGNDRYPTIADRGQLHYLHATIQEVLRISNLAPFGFPRATLNDTELSGMKIPKGTQVIFNFYAIHNDEDYWDKPEEFNPNRFLNEEGKYVTGLNESYMVFGMGRRQCFGEVMAKIELFTFISRLLRDFKVEKAPGEPFPSFEGDLGVTFAPKPYKVAFKARNNNEQSISEEEIQLTGDSEA